MARPLWPEVERLDDTRLRHLPCRPPSEFQRLLHLVIKMLDQAPEPEVGRVLQAAAYVLTWSIRGLSTTELIQLLLTEQEMEQIVASVCEGRQGGEEKPQAAGG